MNKNLTTRDFSKELTFSAQRSSGAGGQNVNKVNTKIELRFSVPESTILSNREKELLISRLAGKLTHKGDLIIMAETERSQLRNKEQAIKRFYNLLEWGLRPVKKRIPTKPSKASKKRRLDAKKKQAEKKNRRKNDF
ncbi:alternative ribosome rescue aminoacyl-tRNA hydrolase ArfB [Marinilabilia salmonicolor]|jgi:ribosome-associated protein|uniref:Ribosome-associated protein n=1 Tax=Marinilabilia salmonicolor TaxID=989 RepID=A0A2T0XAX9_9BACT|nr:alternative ribosome rescue aminoacyl-tRNA hydrolase ArfB [Marinilabilia salmonicolor]PRY96034.1 ribosome-associated protein [Marinilabilia salmonicolor]RCW29449.1 ribosome-associated protein [Marinilabilia salmonicolor]